MYKRQEQTGTLILGGVCCGILLALASSFQQMGIQYTTVGRAGFITACYIVIVPILGHFFLRKKCGATIWIAVALALAGLYLLCITDGFSVGKGDLLVMVCSLLFSLHILVIDYFSPKVDGVKMSCIQFFVCLLYTSLCSHHPDILFQMSKATDYKQNNNLESPRRTVYYHFHLVSKVPPDNVQTHPMSSLYPELQVLLFSACPY